MIEILSLVAGAAVVLELNTNADLQDEMYFDSLEMLAICVEAEAADQNLDGKRAVVDVILNRVDSDIFPDDIPSVIMQENQFASYPDAMNAVYEPSEETFKAVQMELERRTNDEILYFRTEKYHTYGTPCCIVGDHYFNK